MGYTLWINIILLAALAWFTATDIKKRVIWWPVAAALGAGGAIMHLLLPGLAFMESIWGMLPGFGLLLISAACGEALGRGDCYVLIGCGAVLGFSAVFSLLAAALVFAAVWSVLLIVRKKAGRKSELPFMPFLLAAQVCRLFLGGM